MAASELSSSAANSFLPNLFVVGAAKCATTTIYEMLSNTPGVAMSRRKEPMHFADDFRSLPKFERTQNLIRKLTNQHWLIDREEYLSNFPRTEARWYGEGSTTYLQSRTAAANLHAFNPQARIVISLRSPIARAASEYSMRRFLGQTSRTFSEGIREDHQRVLNGEMSIFEPFIQSGLYADQVDRYLSRFPRDQVLIEIIDRPGIGFSQVASNLSAFLGVTVSRNAGRGTGMANVRRAARFPRLNNFLCRTELSTLVSRAVPRPIKESLRDVYYGDRETLVMSAEDEAFLREVFRPDVERLSERLGEDLGFWLEGRSGKSA